MKHIASLLLFAGLTSMANGQTVVLEEDFSNGIPSDWTTEDLDQLTPDQQVVDFNAAWIGFTTATDTCAASTSFYTDSLGQSQDYLITPGLGLLSFGNLLTWESKSFDANFLESYYVLLSTTDNDPSSFTDTIRKVVNDAPYWKSFTVNLFEKGYGNQTVYVAFKNVSTNAFVLGIDNVKVTADDPAATNEVEAQTIKCYPNPTSNQLFIDTQTNVQYQVYNAIGQVILTGNNNIIDVSALNSGLYTIRFESETGWINQQFVKL